MLRHWRLAIIDSGVADAAIRSGLLPMPVASCRFVDNGHQVLTEPVTDDPIGHGTGVAAVICSAPRTVDLLVGQVLEGGRSATAAAVAAAIDWSLKAGANLIHMSLGLREHRPVLATAVALAAQAGCVVVASSPARGAVTFPAAYPQVIRATGDARCQPDEISELNSAQADFGGCPRHGRADLSRRAGMSSEPARHGGASLGAAHVTRFIVDRVSPEANEVSVRMQLSALARYRGIELKRLNLSPEVSTSS